MVDLCLFKIAIYLYSENTHAVLRNTNGLALTILLGFVYVLVIEVRVALFKLQNFWIVVSNEVIAY